jgi:hypothetical protein
VDVIDDESRLLGWVNVIDALVVLVVLAVAVAGATFILSIGEQPEQLAPADAYATLDLGSQPEHVAELIDTGDTVERAGGPNVTVTDVYVAGSGGDRRVRVRARIPGERTGDGLSYDGAPLRVGRTLDLTTSEYQTSGTVTAVDVSNPDLPVQWTDFFPRTDLSAGTAAVSASGIRCAPHCVLVFTSSEFAETPAASEVVQVSQAYLNITNAGSKIFL